MNNDELLALLKELGVPYKIYKHNPIYNAADGEKYGKNISGAICKNLFLQDTNGNLYLAITLKKKKFDLKGAAKQIGAKRLSFVPDETLEKTLGIAPGGVTPLALINDAGNLVVALFDREVLKESELSFHPLVNTETITITVEDMLKFISYCGNKWTSVENTNF